MCTNSGASRQPPVPGRMQVGGKLMSGAPGTVLGCMQTITDRMWLNLTGHMGTGTGPSAVGHLGAEARAAHTDFGSCPAQCPEPFATGTFSTGVVLASCRLGL